MKELEYSSKSGRLQKNIKSTLVQTLISHYGYSDISIAERDAIELLRIHGMAPVNFDYIKNVEMSMTEQFMQDTVAGDVDPNSNKSEKSIKQVMADAQAPFNKVIGYDFLYRTMKEMYGKKEAKRLSGELYSYAIALSDSTQILSPYCYAADFSKLIFDGRDWGNIHSKPAKRVDSYVQQTIETVHEMSNHLAGAIAISTFFFDVAHLILYKDGVNTALPNVTLDDVKNNQVVRKSLENLFQTVIHSVNHTSRNGAESPFTNISIFDRNKIRTIMDTIPHLFVDDLGMGEDGIKDHVIELVFELQKIFMDIFELGDQAQNNRPITFPVTTINLTKDRKENGTFDILEQDVLMEFSKRPLYRYNINASSGNRVAMCCRFQNDYDLMRSQAQTVNSFGGEGISIGSHRVATINLKRVALESTSLSDFEEILDKRVEDAIKVLKAHKQLVTYITNKKFHKFISNGWIRLDNMFSTVGIIASYEMKEVLADKYGHEFNGDYVERALKIIEASTEKYSRQYEVFGNIEEIPGESLATKLPKSDRVLFGDDAVKEVLYSNQFIPLWNDATIYERLEADGKYQQLLTGGGIVHAQIGSEPTPKQYINLINDAVEVGCEHFAINPVICECENGHNIVGDFHTEKCNICEGKIIEQRTRVVGFSTVVSAWVKERREWESPRRTTYYIGDTDKDTKIIKYDSI